MNNKNTKTIRKVLLIISCILFIYGLGASSLAADKRAQSRAEFNHNGKNIIIEMTGINPAYEENAYGYRGYNYIMNMDFKITNMTYAELDEVTVKTTIKNKDGKELVCFTSAFGGYGELNGLGLQKKESITKSSYIEEKDPQTNLGFAEFYVAELSDLTVSHEVISARFSDGYTYNKR